MGVDGAGLGFRFAKLNRCLTGFLVSGGKLGIVVIGIDLLWFSRLGRGFI